jgi:dihydrofolate synthase/folylpolyglutamate synthase
LKNEGLFDYTGIKQHYSDLAIGLHGRHQRANAAVALATLELIADRYSVSEQARRDGLATVQWPGRLEVMRERPLVIIDGAHNSEGVQALVSELNELRRGRRIKLLFAAMADKEWELMLAALGKAVDEIIFTRVSMERSAAPEALAEKLAAGIPRRVISDPQLALGTLLDEALDNDIVVVAGSLYLLGEIRPLLQNIAVTKESTA